ncbi:MAG: antA/AntB antirepressor family protein [Lentisphaeria bacterium]|nr:antA/AntB antirepressor family protein [Lentisphaeria bacterium]
MQEIIAISQSTINGESVNTVNARELWEKLGSKRQFGNWIKEKLSDFEEGTDYTINKIVNGEKDGKFKPKEYTITLDTAKHLAMLERNETGKKIRQYFIEAEKRFRSGYGSTEHLLKTIRQQERILFTMEQELKEWRKLAPACEPGELSEHTGQPRIYLRRVSATSKPTKHSFHRLQMALDEAENILPGFCDALATGRIHAIEISE